MAIIRYVRSNDCRGIMFLTLLNLELDFVFKNFVILQHFAVS